MTKQLAAVTPAELQTAQKGIAEHCQTRIAALEAEKDEAQQNYDRAKRGKWAVKPFANQIRRIERRIEYFEKVQAASERGYLVIPEVWFADTFAIRVKDRNKVRWTSCGNAQIQKLPIGEGEYVDANPIVHKNLIELPDGSTKNVVTHRTADAEIDFPVTLVHPSVIHATEIAMADKIFDTIKIARRGGDPFILGEINSPSSYKNLTFFVAWFLDVTDIG